MNATKTMAALTSIMSQGTAIEGNKYVFIGKCSVRLKGDKSDSGAKARREKRKVARASRKRNR